MMFAELYRLYPGGLLIVCLALTCSLSGQLPLSSSTEDWFPLAPGDYFAPESLDMGHWLDAPAGKHGVLQSEGDGYVFQDGTPVKFWGVNITTWRAFPEPAEGKEWVRFMRKYGVNAVRLHKFTWAATDNVHSTQLTDDHWRRLDAFSESMRNGGIYYSWSHIYGHRVMPADSSRMLAYREIRDLRYPWAHLNGSTSGLVNFAEDLQDINIELTVNMLEHLNPHTGLRYADDPALTFVELQNEDDIFWSAIQAGLKQAPTYRALLCRKFSDWLRAKYGSRAELISAWGGEGLTEEESLDNNSVYPHPDHGWFSGHYARAVAEDRAVPAYVADRARFLYDQQIAYYQRATAAIRKTGYQGLIVSSCWQAGSGITHFYNLYADAQTGPVDRHNYWGGGTGHRLVPGKIKNTSLLVEPGSGLLSTGMQQVRGRPFQFSEWMSLIPNEWTAEAAPLVAAYGMGLQGWDASYSFALDFPHITPTVQARGGVYNVSGPTHLSLYPALAAMVYRGDVEEGAVVADRALTLADLSAGKLPFDETIDQDFDRKSFSGEVSARELARGKVIVSFADEAVVTPQTKALTPEAEIQAITHQLSWRPGETSPRVIINTPGTQGLVGFAPGEKIKLNDVTLSTQNPFAVILVSSLDTVRGIDQADRILVTTIARAQNTDMRYNADRSELLEVGKPPVLLEPVTLKLKLKRRGARAYVLDHTGSRTGEEITVRGRRLLLDGKRYQTFYYEIVYEI